MCILYCLWVQVVVLDIYCIYWIVWDRYMQVLFLGRAPRTKETLPDFLKWRRVTRPPLVFRGLTSSQRTPGKWGVTCTNALRLKEFLKWAWNLSNFRCLSKIFTTSIGTYYLNLSINCLSTSEMNVSRTSTD